MDFLNSLTSYFDWGLLALRLAVGVIFFAHGKAKWAMWKMQPNPQMPAQMLSTMKLLSIAEPLAALALIIGFWTQLAALGLAIIMLGALYFKIKVWKAPFTSQTATGWEFDLMLLAANLALLTTGPGALVLSL
ncbi:DoxX family protein [Candidatus Uhrbacteria bacterium]|nr:DoxX family protein [Candidatus Uhrbacteria bacterium]